MLATTVLGYTLTALWLTFWAVVLIVLFTLVAIWPASIAKAKGKSFWLFFILSIPFWWITLFVVLLMKDESATAPKTTPANDEK